MSDQPVEVPLRPDGTPRAFWYDPEVPYHIMHRRQDGTLKMICSGEHPHV